MRESHINQLKAKTFMILSCAQGLVENKWDTLRDSESTELSLGIEGPCLWRQCYLSDTGKLRGCWVKKR